MIARSRLNVGVPNTLLSHDCQNSLNGIIADIGSGDVARISLGKKNISATYYRGNIVNADGSVTQDVVIALTGIYEDKCAFCEAKRHRPDIEHFRPKKKVTGVNGHNGYYWLCYEWTNLIPACEDCNSAKLNQFPITTLNRIYGPSFDIATRQLDTNSNIFTNQPLFTEGHVLLHPEFDAAIVEQCFAFNNKGEIIGTDAQGRGSETRRICDLDRKDLKYFRQQVLDDYLENFEYALYLKEEDTFIQILNKLRRRASNTSKEYTLFCKYLYNNFIDMLVPLLPIPAQARAEAIYQNNYIPL